MDAHTNARRNVVYAKTTANAANDAASYGGRRPTNTSSSTSWTTAGRYGKQKSTRCRSIP